MRKRCIAIRHVCFEGLGLFEPVLREHGFEIEYWQPGVDQLEPQAFAQADLAFVLGGPIGVYKADQYPFINQELELVRARLAAGKPMAGICLGAQLIAAAAGEKVYFSGRQEIGWWPVTLTEAGQQSCLRHLTGGSAYTLHWHGDTFDLPPGAKLLASSELTINQAYTLNDVVLGLQFHPEVPVRQLETWLIGHCCALSNVGLHPDVLRQQAQTHGEAYEYVARLLLNDWLTEVGLSR